MRSAVRHDLMWHDETRSSGLTWWHIAEHFWLSGKSVWFKTNCVLRNWAAELDEFRLRETERKTRWRYFYSSGLTKQFRIEFISSGTIALVLYSVWCSGFARYDSIWQDKIQRQSWMELLFSDSNGAACQLYLGWLIAAQWNPLLSDGMKRRDRMFWYFIQRLDYIRCCAFRFDTAAD